MTRHRYHQDIQNLRPALEGSNKEIERLRAAIRKHRDQRGDDRCWMDDEELYKVLPEGYVPPERDTSVELEHCRRFIACRRNPATAYVSPERRIEELEEERIRLANVVHILVAGKSFCQRDVVLGPPNTWPEGHVWVGMEQARLATCEKCSLDHLRQHIVNKEFPRPRAT
jgi:hypothetical protein